jgi:hypothetical protein
MRRVHIMPGRSQFVGLAGTYFVAYALTVRGHHAAITIGNVPRVDILVSTTDGSRQIALQVKTRTMAYKHGWYGREAWQWDVGESAVGYHTPNFWYALVDLQQGNGNQESRRSPLVYLVPSIWVSGFVQPDWKRKVYWLRPGQQIEDSKERWDWIARYFNGEEGAIKWAETCPQDAEHHAGEGAG